MPALIALLPFAGALLLALVPNERRRLSAWLAGIFALAGLALALLSAPSIFAGEVLRWSVDWVPALGLDFGFRMDGLAWLFSLLILGIGALVVLYAGYYLHHDDPPARFFQFLQHADVRKSLCGARTQDEGYPCRFRRRRNLPDGTGQKNQGGYQDSRMDEKIS